MYSILVSVYLSYLCMCQSAIVFQSFSTVALSCLSVYQSVVFQSLSLCLCPVSLCQIVTAFQSYCVFVLPRCVPVLSPCSRPCCCVFVLSLCLSLCSSPCHCVFVLSRCVPVCHRVLILVTVSVSCLCVCQSVTVFQSLSLVFVLSLYSMSVCHRLSVLLRLCLFVCLFVCLCVCLCVCVCVCERERE